MNGSEEVGYEGFSYPNWNATATQSPEQTSSTPTQTFQNPNVPFHVVTPKSASSTSATAATSGGMQYSNGATTSANNNTTTAGVTRVPSVSGSYFHQRSVSKSNFVPFISPTSASTNTSTTPASIATTTYNNNNNNNSVETIKNCDINTINNNASSGNSNVVSNSHLVMTSGNSTSISTPHPSHPTNLFSSVTSSPPPPPPTSATATNNSANSNNFVDDNCNNISKGYMWHENDKLPASVAAKTKSPLPAFNPTPLHSQQEQQRISTPQIISSHVSIHQQHNNSNTSSSGSKHIFKQQDAAHVTINDRSAKSFVPFVQSSSAPPLTTLVPSNNMPNNVNEGNNMPYYNNLPSSNNSNHGSSSINSNAGYNGSRTCNTAMTPFPPPPPPPVDPLTTQPTSELNTSEMNFFNRTSEPALITKSSSSSSPITTKAATTTVIGGGGGGGGGSALFASSASTPFVQQANDINNTTNVNNTTSAGYYLPSTDPQQQWNATSMLSSQNQLRHRKRNGETDNVKRSKWSMGSLLHRLLRRGDDVDSDTTDEDNVNSESNNDNEEDENYDDDNNNIDGTINSRSSTAYNNFNNSNTSNNHNQVNGTSPSRPTLFQQNAQEQPIHLHKHKRKKRNAHKPRPLYQTRFGHPEDDLPLLTELGIYPYNILRKALVVLNPLQSISQEVMIDTDLTGPLIFAIALAILLSLHGKIQFSAIYGLCVLGMILFKFLLSLMHDKSVPLQFIMSALGYALLPNLILAFIRNLQYWLIGSFGRVLMPAAILTILWSSWCATTLLVKGQGMETQRYLVLYPVILFYAIFAALTIF